jgi:hypothetical protein
MAPMDNLSSEELMAKIAEGDNDSFEILVNRHQTSALNLIYRFVGDRTPVSPPWEVDLLPAFAKDAEAGSRVVRLPVIVFAGLMATSMALSLAADGLVSYVMGRWTARMKPAEILRNM